MASEMPNICSKKRTTTHRPRSGRTKINKLKLMKKLILLYSIFITCFSYSQNKVDLEFQNYLSDFRNFNFEELKQKKFESIIINPTECKYPKTRKEVSRVLDFDISEDIYTINLGYKDSSYFRFKAYTLHILRKDNDIIGIICMEKFTDKQSVHFYSNMKEINNFINKHNLFYNTNTSQSDLIEDLTRNIEYGYCLDKHILDTRNRRQKIMDKFGNTLNTTDFRNLLSSYNVESQSFGVDGLESIYDSLYLNLTPEQKNKKSIDLHIISHIKNRNSTLKKCDGTNSAIFVNTRN